MEKCSECGADLILRPAGIARITGKPYDAFLACSSGQRHRQSKPSSQGFPRIQSNEAKEIFEAEVLQRLDKLVIQSKIIIDRLNNELPEGE